MKKLALSENKLLEKSAFSIIPLLLDRRFNLLLIRNVWKYRGTFLSLWSCYVFYLPLQTKFQWPAKPLSIDNKEPISFKPFTIHLWVMLFRNTLAVKLSCNIWWKAANYLLQVGKELGSEARVEQEIDKRVVSAVV